MKQTHHIYLVPGFFGFANLGDLKYFAHVQDILQAAFARLGIDVAVHPVRTWPTASVRKRTLRLLQAIAETAGDSDAPIHLIGHSSGGLDARMLVAAGASLSEDLPAERYAARVQSVVTVASPHRGTPLAATFDSVFGQRVLQVLSLATMYVLRYGRLPLSAVLRMGSTLVRLDSRMGGGQDPIDQLFGELLHDFSDERQQAIREFFTEVGEDQALLAQLTLPGMDVFNATTRDQPEVRYGCVLTRGRPPGFRSTMASGLGAYAQASHALYVALYRLAAQTPLERASKPDHPQIVAMRQAWGDTPDLRANDGIVPTLSQLWGEVICAVVADHHDVIGHFDDPDHDPPHYDWISSGSGFKRNDFEYLWVCVANWIAAGILRGSTGT